MGGYLLCTPQLCLLQYIRKEGSGLNSPEPSFVYHLPSCEHNAWRYRRMCRLQRCNPMPCLLCRMKHGTHTNSFQVQAHILPTPRFVSFWRRGWYQGNSDTRRICLASSSFHIRQCAHIGPLFVMSSVVVRCQTQKSVKSRLFIPRIEALALPIVVEQTTLEPTPI